MRDQAKLKEARELRSNSTWPEQKMWEHLSNRQLGGFKFLRQATVGPFIADFLCREKKLIIELDGWTHSTPDELASDESRTRYLNANGYRVIRFGNHDVMESTDGVLDSILKELQG